VGIIHHAAPYRSSQQRDELMMDFLARVEDRRKSESVSWIRSRPCQLLAEPDNSIDVEGNVA